MIPGLEAMAGNTADTAEVMCIHKTLIAESVTRNVETEWSDEPDHRHHNIALAVDLRPLRCESAGREDISR